MTRTKAHVVYVLPVLRPAGAERIVAELALRMPALGFAASVICLEDERAAVGAELKAAGVEVVGLRLSRRRTIACARALRRVLPPDRPLVVHSHLFHANIAARLAVRGLTPARRAGVQVVSTIHVVERRFRPWQFLLDRLTAPWAAAEVCVSPAAAKFQQVRTGLPASFFPVIENGIDTGRFPPRPPGGASTSPRVVSLGRLDPQKDYPTLLCAWAEVLKACPAARLVIGGEGPRRRELEALCRALGLTGVDLPGFVRDVPQFLRSADLYVQPSAWEGFGLAVVEAMCCGLPVVVSDADSLPDLVRHGQTGWVVPKADPAALAAAILRAMRDPAGAATTGAAARAEAVRRFSIERMVGEYASLYDALVGPAVAPSPAAPGVARR